MVLIATLPMKNNNINMSAKDYTYFSKRYAAEFGEDQKRSVVSKTLRISVIYNNIEMVLREITSAHALVEGSTNSAGKQICQ
jgi:hypothetical protein